MWACYVSSSSSREVRVTVPTFSVVCFGMGGAILENLVVLFGKPKATHSLGAPLKKKGPPTSLALGKAKPSGRLFRYLFCPEKAA